MVTQSYVPLVLWGVFEHESKVLEFTALRVHQVQIEHSGDHRCKNVRYIFAKGLWGDVLT